MDDDDHDELLQCSDDDSLSDSDDTTAPIDKLPHQPVLAHTNHSRTEFFILKIVLLLSSVALVILLPLFQESANVKSDAYTILYFTSSGSVGFLFLGVILARKLLKWKYVLSKLPIKCSEVIISAGLYTLSGFFVVYALDRKRVMCHLQDPMKGLVLVFSLVYYFFFCKKLMGLQRIFSATTIIVGLFISVDYGLCDEFRCRGNDRERKSDDAGDWSWQTHTTWATIYILGLATFSGVFVLIDRYLVTPTVISSYDTMTSQLLSTVSRLVSGQSDPPSTSRPLTTMKLQKRDYHALPIAFWIHVFGWFFTNGFFWIDAIPHVGRNENFNQFFNHSTSGLLCIFALPFFEAKDCGHISIYAWIFLFVYMIFFVSALRFLILSQSAVYTIATMTASLPIVGIWWSLFRIAPEINFIAWSPSFSGELICALLGLPIVAVGLVLFGKSHFRDVQHLRSPTSSSAEIAGPLA